MEYEQSKKEQQSRRSRWLRRSKKDQNSGKPFRIRVRRWLPWVILATGVINMGLNSWEVKKEHDLSHRQEQLEQCLKTPQGKSSQAQEQQDKRDEVEQIRGRVESGKEFLQIGAQDKEMLDVAERNFIKAATRTIELGRQALESRESGEETANTRVLKERISELEERLWAYVDRNGLGKDERAEALIGIGNATLGAGKVLVNLYGLAAMNARPEDEPRDSQRG